ncbi:ligase-associated DNA damage response endonuclease PdeM [Aquamicrobium defluvii]|uniref:Metallophosphatase n=1 Tax=Aquamicrobium defluvii TaxID=69279 RepID=A0A011TZ96_9HYPH|nr:ligase-associated DNA damage response endonuclease PdeM [Aquamicrobium defluvii]EXL09427.1 metallophosphatase [Aquamicrobium defluvii]EZQ13619.1 metallophosphatase [Halopseudomonas bauzanensis]TDR33572.1 putative phosphoesterase [Aquamicrobium defluvii]
MNFVPATVAVPDAAELVVIAGERAVCDARGVLYFPEMDMLAVSDLHLEKGSSLARRGALVPPYDTIATLARLQEALDLYRPRIVVSLGDSFHDGEGATRLHPAFRERLEAMMAGRNWFWIAGNHDPDAPADLPGDTVRELAIGALLFRHEPSRIPVEGEIAGHLHPCARIVQRGRSVRRRCFASDGTRMVMPAFGAYTGSLNVLDRAYAGLFRRESLMAYMMGRDRVFAIAGSMLRPG